MALAPVWASIWPIFTTSWARAEVTASPSTASMKTALFTMTPRPGRVMTISFDLTGVSLLEKPLGDDLFHHLGGARGNGPEPHVAEEALHGELPHVAVAAVELDRLVRDPVGHLGAEELGHGDLGDAVPPGIVEPRRVVHQMPRGLDLRGHLGHPMPEGLLVAQRAAEGVARLEVSPGVLERLGRARERQHRGHDALALEPGRELLETSPLDPQEILRRHGAVVEGQLRRVGGEHAHLVELAADREARQPPLDQEHRETVVAPLGRA